MTSIITILPIVLIAIYIYNKDKNKEPTKLLAKLFVSGFLSIVLTLVLSIFLDLFIPFIMVENTKDLDKIVLLLHAVIGVGLIEEFSKWIVTYKIAYNNDEFDELYDIIIYSVFVSLGFATLENIMYVADYGLGTAIIRAISSIPGHASFGVFMGYYLGLAKNSQIDMDNANQTKYLILSIVVPTILHGFYDYCLFTENGIFLLVFFVFVCTLFSKAHKRINKTSKEEKILKHKDNNQNIQSMNNPQNVAQMNISQNIQYKNNYCPNCGTKVNSNFCPICGRKNE